MSENNTYDYYEERGEKPKEGWLSRKWRQFIKFYEAHEGAVNMAGALILGGAGTIAGISRDLTKRKSIKADYELKNLYVYDRKMGHYWKLRKPLSNRDWLDINEAIKSGGNMGDILSNMNVLAKK